MRLDWSLCLSLFPLIKILICGFSFLRPITISSVYTNQLQPLYSAFCFNKCLIIAASPLSFPITNLNFFQKIKNALRLLTFSSQKKKSAQKRFDRFSLGPYYLSFCYFIFNIPSVVEIPINNQNKGHSNVYCCCFFLNRIQSQTTGMCMLKSCWL